MEKSEIFNILVDWNFWKKDIDTGIRREELLKKVFSLLKTKEVIVIKGIRRSGKSTLLLQVCKDLLKQGVKKEDILIINLEDPRFKKLDLELLNKIYEIYLSEINPDEKHYVFLDEVQVIDGWEKFVRYLHENKRINVLVTGSSSKLLSSEYSTVLAGRHLDIEVTQLSFKEYLNFMGIEIKNKIDLVANRHKIRKVFNDYLKFGGFPKVSLLKSDKEKIDLLGTYFKDIIIKDIVMRHKIRQIDKLEELAKYYLTNVSTLQSFNKIRILLKLSLDTIERFSSYLSEVYMLSFVRKFSYSKKEQILNPRKVYCSDNGLRNSVAFLFSKDLGRLTENIVFNKLNRDFSEIYYWKNNLNEEVDFVVKERLKIKQLIQVCYNIEDDKTKKREIKSLLKASKELKCNNLLILNEDYEAEEKIDNKKIKFIPLWKWLLNFNPYDK